MYTIIISIQLYPETIKIQNIKKHSLSQFSQIISRKKNTPAASFPAAPPGQGAYRASRARSARHGPPSMPPNAPGPRSPPSEKPNRKAKKMVHNPKLNVVFIETLFISIQKILEVFWIKFLGLDTCGYAQYLFKPTCLFSCQSGPPHIYDL